MSVPKHLASWTPPQNKRETGQNRRMVYKKRRCYGYLSGIKCRTSRHPRCPFPAPPHPTDTAYPAAATGVGNFFQIWREISGEGEIQHRRQPTGRGVLPLFRADLCPGRVTAGGQPDASTWMPAPVAELALFCSALSCAQLGHITKCRNPPRGDRGGETVSFC